MNYDLMSYDLGTAQPRMDTDLPDVNPGSELIVCAIRVCMR
ncbi:MAG TPA: hypothetical protein VLT36_23305 [Candidatus Dormibacteraeota bacterium]|nr:hypothetical protein [Candidatus Dormibacteraeota bacterium]